MKKQIFPVEFLEQTAEVQLIRHSTRSVAIYLLILTAVVAGLVSLPFIKVTVYTSGRGMIRAESERVPVMLLQSGKTSENRLIDQKDVCSGDTLLIIQHQHLKQELLNVESQLLKINRLMVDLDYILDNASGSIQSQDLIRQYRHYASSLSELRLKKHINERKLQRQQQLFQKGVISKVEFDNSSFELQLAIHALTKHRNQARAEWQNLLSGYKDQALQLLERRANLVKAISESIYVAPIDGTVLIASSQNLGDHITAGKIVADISPDTGLLVECILPSQDVGLIRKGITSSYQIDALPYTQWGIASGEVLEVGKDVEFQEQKPVFRIKCSLDEAQLSLVNGGSILLKKGMTLTAHFPIAERSLFQLLFDQTNDWLHPGRSTYMANNTKQ